MLTGLLLAQLVAERGPLARADRRPAHLGAPGARQRRGRRRRRARRTPPRCGRDVDQARAPSSATAAASLLRASGTEPLVRIMVEAEDEARAAPHRRTRCARACSTPSGRSADPRVALRTCAASSASSAPRTRSGSCSRASSASSTAATTPRASRSRRLTASLWRCRAADGTRSVAALAERCAAAPARTRRRASATRAGRPTARPIEANAHPQVDCAGSIAVIHNGIIENHAALAERLRAAGHTYASGTDTEVLAHLIEDHRAAGLDLPDAVAAALREVTGRLLDRRARRGDAGPDRRGAARLAAHRRARATASTYLASDIPAILEHTRDLVAVEDDQVAVLTAGGLELHDLDGASVDADRAARRLGRGDRRARRAPRLHDQGDLRAARGDPRDARGAARRRRARSSSTSCG